MPSLLDNPVPQGRWSGSTSVICLPQDPRPYVEDESIVGDRGPIVPRLLTLALAFLALQPALGDIEDCASREFHREFLAGSPMEPVEGVRCGLTSPNPTLVKAGDRVLPCLAEIVEGTGAKFPECRKEPRLCRNWAMGAIAASVRLGPHPT